MANDQWLISSIDDIAKGQYDCYKPGFHSSIAYLLNLNLNKAHYLQKRSSNGVAPFVDTDNFMDRLDALTWPTQFEGWPLKKVGSEVDTTPTLTRTMLTLTLTITPLDVAMPAIATPHILAMPVVDTPPSTMPFS
ncbi:hypothetical protein GOBAR_AA10917 [Gossypium barbadense]|uniref:Uncharacterized protein n=1 Tax=Gossypium barbadense TaxID=3634 RepID=A0A2P5Y2B3_GOSBA|nr:hypothetical protein GOBAR_AA10917 [Gossypium barbadense]